jgi:hypothetical protein
VVTRQANPCGDGGGRNKRYAGLTGYDIQSCAAAVKKDYGKVSIRGGVVCLPETQFYTQQSFETLTTRTNTSTRSASSDIHTRSMLFCPNSSGHTTFCLRLATLSMPLALLSVGDFVLK